MSEKIFDNLSIKVYIEFENRSPLYQEDWLLGLLNNNPYLDFFIVKNFKNQIDNVPQFFNKNWRKIHFY